MTLLDLRKAAIRKQLKIRFVLRNGLECVIGEDGVARVPELNRTPDFNLDRELEAAQSFTLEPAAVPGQKNAVKPKPTPMSRQQMSTLASDTPASVAAHDEHDDE
jgi:hypothetical protein